MQIGTRFLRRLVVRVLPRALAEILPLPARAASVDRVPVVRRSKEHVEVQRHANLAAEAEALAIRAGVVVDLRRFYFKRERMALKTPTPELNIKIIWVALVLMPRDQLCSDPAFRANRE